MTDLAVVNQVADLEKLFKPKPILQELGSNVKVMLADAKGMTVNSEASGKLATERGQAAKALVDSLEIQRKEIVDPMTKHTRTINQMFKGPRDDAQATVDTLEEKVSYYTDQKNRKVEEVAAQERKRIGKNYGAQVKRAESSGHAAPPPPPMPEATKQTVEGSKQKSVWEYEVLEINRIPAKYLEVKHGKILQGLADGEEIPGIKASKKTSTSFTT
ncbi:hypothetical protein LCGC14_0451290 [marine sediment metagenome]|uniref:Uncharacterized protein n=1 Tax=marine sediment metagenome TaxID=412755 RepID=A0A0F9VRU8_9ZZZZ